MFGFGKDNKKKFQEDLKWTPEDSQKTKNYLLRQLRDYLEFNEDDPEHIEMVCRIVDSLANINKIDSNHK